MNEQRQTGPQTQRGAAAIEFALVLPILVVIFFGIVTFGSVLYTQMVVSRAAEDAARAAGLMTKATTYAAVPESVKTAVKNEVINSLANSLIAPSAQNSSYASRHAWMLNNVYSKITVDNGICGTGAAAANTVRVRVQFPASSTRMLPNINLPPFGDLGRWMPATLTGCAVIQL